jgi:hypothetical protein
VENGSAVIPESKVEPVPVQPEPEPEPEPVLTQPGPVAVPVNSEPVPAKPPPSAGDLLVDLLGPLMIEGPPGPQVPSSGLQIPPSGPAAPVPDVPQQNLNQGLDLGQELAGALAITTLADQTNSVQVSFQSQLTPYCLVCHWAP